MYERLLVPLDGSDIAEAILPFVQKSKAYLCTIRDRLAAKGIRVRTGLRSGAPAPEIVAAAATWGVDLIAMATHGRSGLGRVLFGSVAETVLRAAPVPVLMIRMTAKAATVHRSGRPSPGSHRGTRSASRGAG